MLEVDRGHLSIQSSDEGIGTTTCTYDTIDGGDSPPVRDTGSYIEPDWDQPRYWQQKTWEGSITR